MHWSKGIKYAQMGGTSPHNLRGSAVLKEDVKRYRQAWQDAAHPGDPTTVVRIPTLGGAKILVAPPARRPPRPRCDRHPPSRHRRTPSRHPPDTAAAAPWRGQRGYGCRSTLGRRACRARRVSPRPRPRGRAADAKPRGPLDHQWQWVPGGALHPEPRPARDPRGWFNGLRSAYLRLLGRSGPETDVHAGQCPD